MHVKTSMLSVVSFFNGKQRAAAFLKTAYHSPCLIFGYFNFFAHTLNTGIFLCAAVYHFSVKTDIVSVKFFSANYAGTHRSTTFAI